MSKNIHILLVEDNPGDIKLTQMIFAELKLNIHLSVVQDGAEAIEFLLKEGQYAKAKTPNLILLDLNLPKKDGIEVLKEVKCHPLLKRIPVIVLSTTAAESDILDCYDLHANCVIKKPISLDAFLKVVKAIEDFWLQNVTFPPKTSLKHS